MSQLPRVNCHVHVFNFEIVTTEWAKDVVEKRIGHDYGDAAANVLGGLARKVVDGISKLNEEELLRLLVDELEKLDVEVPKGLEGLALRALRRQVDRWLDRLRRDDALDFRKADAHDLLETLRIAGKASLQDVTDWLMVQLGENDAVVPLMMDLTDGVSDVDDVPAGERSKFRRQLDETSKMVLRYPGRVLPFVFVHPKRPDHFELMVEALDALGFVGVKLYPSLGYELTTPEMRRVFGHCEARGIPLLVHTNSAGFVGADGANRFPDPDTWREEILPDFPNLVVCMAHFGGSGQLVQPFTPGDDPIRLPLRPPNADGTPGEPRWGQKILDLLLEARFSNVFGDVAFHRAPMDSDENERNYFGRLQALLERDDTGGQIVFGTDYWLIRPRLRESSHWRYFEDRLDEAAFERLAVENPARFLGLPGGGRENAAIEKYVRFLATELQKPEVIEAIASPPAPWLLAAIENHPDFGVDVRKEIETRAEARSVAARLLGVDRWRELLAEVRALPLAADLPAPLDQPLEVDLERVTTSLLGAAVGFEAEASLEARAFHDPDDEDQRDPDAILLPPSEEGLVPFLDDHAWLKLRLAAKLAVDANASDSFASEGVASLAIDAEKEVVFTDYRAHDRDARLVDALGGALGRPRFALSRDDVLRLGPGDAVSFATRGRIGGELTLTWSDVFTRGLDALARAVGSRMPLRLTVDLGVAVFARLEVEDDFRVAFARNGDRIRVSVRKLASRGQSAGVAVRGGVQFEDPDAVRTALGQLVAQRLGQAQAEVDRFLDLEEVDTAEDRDLLAELEAELGAQGRAAVQGAILALYAKLQEAIEKIATARLEAGFTYQYERIETRVAVFEADLSEPLVEQLHHELVEGDFSGALQRHRVGHSGIDLHQFLRFREIIRRDAWGFHLGSAGHRSQETKIFRESEDVAERRKIAFIGLEQYEESWPDVSEGDLALRKWNWDVDLRAEMREFREAPKLADYTFGLAFRMRWEGPLHKSRFAEWLDQARLWRAVDPELELDTIFDALEPLHRKEVAVQLEMLFDHATLARLVHGPLATVPTTEARRALEAGAFAAALPYRDTSARHSPARRRELFSELWNDFLREETEVTFNQRGRRERARHWADRAASALDQAGLHQAASKERNFRPTPTSSTVFPWTIGGRLTLDGAPLDELEDFRRGLDTLRDVIAHPRTGAVGDRDLPAERVEKLFRNLEAFWDQTHYLRTAGTVLVDAALAEGVLGDVQSSFTISRIDADAGRADLAGVPGS